MCHSRVPDCRTVTTVRSRGGWRGSQGFTWSSPPTVEDFDLGVLKGHRPTPIPPVSPEGPRRVDPDSTGRGLGGPPVRRQDDHPSGPWLLLSNRTDGRVV